MRHVLTTGDTHSSGGAGEQEVMKENWDVELISVDASQKIKIIKHLKDKLNLGLKEAKDLVDNAPKILKQCKKDEAEDFRKELEVIGCVIEIK